MRAIPVLNTFAPAPYQRGTGSYVVRYTDRSYDTAQWKMVWSTENAEGVGGLDSIGGWDKENLAVLPDWGKRGVVRRDGNWFVQDFPDDSLHNLYYKDEKTFYIIVHRDGFGLGNCVRFNLSSYSVVDSRSTFSFCQLDKDYFQLFVPHIHVNSIVIGERLDELSNGKTSRVIDDEKRAWIWKDNNTNIKTHVGTLGRALFHSFANGNALAYNDGRMYQYRGGLWYEHYEVYVDQANDLWVIDEENFILVGNGISRFREGKEDHPTVSALGELSNRGTYLAVWGVDMDKFWVLDRKGNVAQFDKSGSRVAVRGPKLDRDYFVDAWVSPEGVVYAITSEEVYRLD